MDTTAAYTLAGGLTISPTTVIKDMNEKRTCGYQGCELGLLCSADSEVLHLDMIIISLSYQRVF